MIVVPMPLPLPDVDLAGNVVPAALAPPTVAAPLPEDVGKFEAAFSPPRGVTIQDLDSVPPPVEPAVVTPDTLGERILASVDRMRDGYKEGVVRMDVAMRSDEVRLSDMMRVMVDAMQMSMQQEMFSKMVGRATQNVEQLLKGQ